MIWVDVRNLIIFYILICLYGIGIGIVLMGLRSARKPWGISLLWSIFWPVRIGLELSETLK